MPIYEYVCDACGERVEAIQRVDDPPLAECPKCGGSLRKAISAPSFQFKGSGWYVTDYAGKGRGKEGGEKKEAGSGAKAAEGGGAKGEGAKKSAASPGSE